MKAPSHHVTSHHITSHQITSHRITSHHTTTLTLTLTLTWCEVMMWRDVICCDVMWRAVMWCDLMWCDVMWCDVTWCDVMWCDVTWCDVMWSDAMWCDVMWRDVMVLSSTSNFVIIERILRSLDLSSTISSRELARSFSSCFTILKDLSSFARRVSTEVFNLLSRDRDSVSSFFIL